LLFEFPDLYFFPFILYISGGTTLNLSE